MSDKLPDNVKRIDVLRIEYGMKKLCQCNNPHYMVDYQNKLVHCTDCKAIVDPFEALCNIARHYDNLGDQVEHLLKQRREIANYKPWLLVFRNLEREYRGKQMLPICPECKEPFYFEHINMWTNRKMHELRIKKTE